jgi:hypothetical protein
MGHCERRYQRTCHQHVLISRTVLGPETIRPMANSVVNPVQTQPAAAARRVQWPRASGPAASLAAKAANAAVAAAAVIR